MTYPKVVTASRKDLGAIANKVGNETRAEITSQVDGITSLPTQGSTNAKDEEEEGQWQHLTGADVVVIDKGKDDKLKNGAGEKLGEEHAGTGHKRSGVCAKDTGGSIGAADGSDSGAALEVINGRLVVAVNDGSAGHGTKKLGQGVDGELAPGVATVDAVGQGDCRVDMPARLAADVDTKHDADAVDCQFAGLARQCVR